MDLETGSPGLAAAPLRIIWRQQGETTKLGSAARAFQGCCFCGVGGTEWWRRCWVWQCIHTTSSGEVKDSKSRSVWTGVLDAKCVSSVVDMGWRIHTAELCTRSSTQGYIQHMWRPQGARPVCKSCFPEVENHCQSVGTVKLLLTCGV